MRGARRGRARRMMECIVGGEKATRWVWRALADERVWRSIGGFVGKLRLRLRRMVVRVAWR